MAKEIKDLQKLIEEKAKERLHNDIMALSRTISGNPLIIGSENIRIQLAGRTRTDSPSDFFYWSNPFMTTLEAEWLPKYVEEEAQNLLNKIERVSSDVEDLLNFKNQQEDD